MMEWLLSSEEGMTDMEFLRALYAILARKQGEKM
jgi:hypothetical protein